MKRKKKSNPFSLFSFQDIITGLCGIMIFFVLIMIVDLAMSRTVNATSDPTKSAAEQQIDALNKRITALQAEFKALQAEQDLLMETQPTPSTEIDRYTDEVKNREMQRENLRIKEEIDRLKRDYQQQKARYEADAQQLVEKRKEQTLLATEARKEIEEKALVGVTYIPESSMAKEPTFVLCDCEAVTVFQKRNGSAGYTSKTLPFETLKSAFANLLSTELNPRKDSVIFLIRPSGIYACDMLIGIAVDQGYSFGREPVEEETQIAIGGLRK